MHHGALDREHHRQGRRAEPMMHLNYSGSELSLYIYIQHAREGPCAAQLLRRLLVCEVRVYLYPAAALGGISQISPRWYPATERCRIILHLGTRGGGSFEMLLSFVLFAAIHKPAALAPWQVMPTVFCLRGRARHKAKGTGRGRVFSQGRSTIIRSQKLTKTEM